MDLKDTIPNDFLKQAEIDAWLKTAEFIKQTGYEVELFRNACKELTLAITAMNERLIKMHDILLNIHYKNNKEKNEH